MRRACGGAGGERLGWAESGRKYSWMLNLARALSLDFFDMARTLPYWWAVAEQDARICGTLPQSGTSPEALVGEQALKVGRAEWPASGLGRSADRGVTAHAKRCPARSRFRGPVSAHIATHALRHSGRVSHNVTQAPKPRAALGNAWVGKMNAQRDSDARGVLPWTHIVAPHNGQANHRRDATG